MLAHPGQVVRALLTYTDWWQPETTSVLQAVRRSTGRPEAFRGGLLDTLDERTELCRRMGGLADRDRHLLYLWYLEQRPVEEIAREVGLSRRQCFRRRARAVRAIVELGEAAASA